MVDGPSLDGHRLGKIAREVNIQAFCNGEPVGYELKGDDVEETLKAINSLRNLDLFSLTARELGVVGIADDNGTATSCDD